MRGHLFLHIRLILSCPFAVEFGHNKRTNIPKMRYKNLSSHQQNLAASPEMLSPHSIVDAGTISHNILYIRPHKHKRVVVMTPR